LFTFSAISLSPKSTLAVPCDEKEIEKEVDFFAWEKLDYVDQLKDEFGL